MKRFNPKLPFVLLMGSMLSYTACKKDEEAPAPILSKPLIESVTPSEGTVGTEISIKGVSFSENAKVLVGTVEATSVERISDMQLYAFVPAGIAEGVLLPVTVRNSDGGQVVKNDAFKTIAPVLSFVNSATKPSGNTGSTVILEGNAFGDLQGAEGRVYFTDINGQPLAAGTDGVIPAADWTNTFIVTTVPTGAVDGEIKVVTATGESNVLHFDITDGATFSPSNISWAKTANLNTAVSSHQAVYATIDNASGVTDHFIYVTGGKTDVAVDKVQLGKLSASGTIAEWVLSASAMPSAVSSHASLAATPFNSKVSGAGFLYVLGGIVGTDVVQTISAAPLNNDGTLGAWRSEIDLPMPLHSMGVALFRGSIYVAGGATTGNVPVAKVYRSQIDTEGRLGAWEELASLPSARAYHGFVSFGGYLYSVGGETGTVTPDSKTSASPLSEILMAKINLRTGAINTDGWQVTTALGKARSKHTTLVAGGTLYVTCGLYSAASTGSSESTYAAFLEGGGVDAFGGATGGSTIQGIGGSYLFNQSGVSYMDANGGIHVMIIGGDDINAPGTKQPESIYY